MKSKMTFIAVLTSMAAAVLVAVSCDKSFYEPKGYEVKDSPFLSEFLSLNEVFFASQPKTKSPNWGNIWKITKTDVFGAAKILAGDPMSAYATYTLLASQQYAFVAVAAAYGAIPASYRQYKNSTCAGYAVPNTETTINRLNYAFCDYIESLYENQGMNVVLRIPGNYSVNDLTTPIDESMIVYPNQYQYLENVGVFHNNILDIMDNTNYQFVNVEDYELIFDADMEDLNDSLVVRASRIIDVITEDFSYDDFFDGTDPIGAVLLAFEDLYDNYVNSLYDVETIVNAYINTVAASNDLTEVQKTSLISALTVAAYSSIYWYDHMGFNGELI